MGERLPNNNYSNSVHASKCDLVGKPNEVSNLRLIKFYKSIQESKLEERYRIERGNVQLWNNEFWTQHNKQFAQEKQNYQKLLGDHAGNDKMSVFYKEFLDKHWRSHVEYNVQWYKKNALLVILDLRIKLNKILKRCKFK